MNQCRFEHDLAACLRRRATPTREEARGALLTSTHPCYCCTIGTRRAREEAMQRAARFDPIGQAVKR
jgi:hypothetical protein